MKRAPTYSAEREEKLVKEYAALRAKLAAGGLTAEHRFRIKNRMVKLDQLIRSN